MTRRQLLIALAAAALAAVVGIGLAQSGGAGGDRTGEKPSRRSLADARRALAGAPAPLAALYRQGNRILPASPATVKARLAALRGYPVVVNKWASWCGPCRAEFPFFQDISVRYGKRVAFLGLNAGDNHANALRFLRRYPVPYPSYEDPNERTAFALHASTNFPVTIFYDAGGRQVYLHQGGYATQDALAQDVRRYALHGGRGA